MICGSSHTCRLWSPKPRWRYACVVDDGDLVCFRPLFPVFWLRVVHVHYAPVSRLWRIQIYVDYPNPDPCALRIDQELTIDDVSIFLRPVATIAQPHVSIFSLEYLRWGEVNHSPGDITTYQMFHYLMNNPRGEYIKLRNMCPCAETVTLFTCSKHCGNMATLRIKSCERARARLVSWRTRQRRQMKSMLAGYESERDVKKAERCGALLMCSPCDIFRLCTLFSFLA